MRSFDFRHTLINLCSFETLMSRQTFRYTAFFFGTSLCLPILISTFSTLMSGFALVFPRPTVCSKLFSFPTLNSRRMNSNVSIIAWIQFVRSSHDTKMRNEMRSSIKTISFTDFSASSSEWVVRLLALMESSSVVSLSLDPMKLQIVVCHEDQRLLETDRRGT